MASDAGENLVLTPEEVAEFLRVDPTDVRKLLELGDLAGLKVAGEWRILWAAVEDFLGREMEAERWRALARRSADPGTRASIARRMPELQEREFEAGTVGAWLKDALRAEEAEIAAGNVLPFDRPRGD